MSKVSGENKLNNSDHINNAPLSLKLQLRQFNCVKRIVKDLLIKYHAKIMNKKNGVLFIGYAEAALGIGESFRSMLNAIDGTFLHFAIYPFNVNVESRYTGPFMKHYYDMQNLYKINVIEVAVDQMPFVRSHLRKHIVGGSYNILRTAWELAEAPASWASHLKDVHEIWAATHFVAESFKEIFNGEIKIIPQCIVVQTEKRYNRQYFKMKNDIFYFIFSFDYYSSAARKNPLAVLRAFADAFPAIQDKVGLILKTTGPSMLHPETSAEIIRFANSDPRVIVINSSMEKNEVLSLIRLADCYISLHRSEGFGLGMAEAMALGRPVVATNYSGNTDFLTEETGYPVPYRLVEVKPGDYPFSEGQFWANPNHDVAVDTLQNVFENSEERERRANAGMHFVQKHYSRDVFRTAVKLRLDEIATIIR